MKKFIISFVILIIFGAAVFVLGWLEFFVPVNNIGIMVSKTGGVHTEVIQAGNFSWSWERLIPTNSKIRLFSLVPQTYTKTIKGSLPSAELYKNMVEGNPSFDYNFSVTIDMNIKTMALPDFIKRTGAEDQDALNRYLEQQADTIARSVIQYVLEHSMNDADFVVEASLSDTELITAISANSRFPDLDIATIYINNVTLPDVTMYNFAKNSYVAYQDAAQQALDNAFELPGLNAAQDYLELERLSKLGQVLAEYPNLIEFMAVTNGNLDFELPSDIPQVNEISQ